MIISNDMINNCIPCNGGMNRYSNALPWYEELIRPNGRNLQQISNLIGNYVGEAYQFDKKTIKMSDFKWLVCQIIKNSDQQDYEFWLLQIVRIEAALSFYASRRGPMPDWFKELSEKCRVASTCKRLQFKVWYIAGVVSWLYYCLNRSNTARYHHRDLKDVHMLLRAVSLDITNRSFNEAYARMNTGNLSSYNELGSRLGIEGLKIAECY